MQTVAFRIVMLSVTMLSVVKPNVDTLSAVMLKAFILKVNARNWFSLRWSGQGGESYGAFPFSQGFLLGSSV